MFAAHAHVEAMERKSFVHTPNAMFDLSPAKAKLLA